MSISGEAMDKLNNSVRTSEVDPKDFVALFVPGGHGRPPKPHLQCLLCLGGHTLTKHTLEAQYNARCLLCALRLHTQDMHGRCTCRFTMSNAMMVALPAILLTSPLKRSPGKNARCVLACRHHGGRSQGHEAPGGSLRQAGACAAGHRHSPIIPQLDLSDNDVIPPIYYETAAWQSAPGIAFWQNDFAI